MPFSNMITKYILNLLEKLLRVVKNKFYHTHNQSHSPLYPDDFKNKNKNCCKTKMPFVYIKKSKQIPNMASLLPRHSSCSGQK